MSTGKKVMLTMQEALRLDLIEAVVANEISLDEAAESMEVTPRHSRRLLDRYHQMGPSGLINQRRGKPSNNRLPVKLKARAITLLTSECRKLGPTRARLHLATHHHIELSTETVRRLMTELNLWTPRKN